MFYFGTNFKMHQTAEESRQFVQALIKHDMADVQLFLIPPFTSLQGLTQISEHIWIGAQNMHYADEGAYTGEISPKMLAALDLDMVMLGHAERRQHFGETDEALNKKVLAGLDYGLRVLLCVGENAREKHFGVERETVTRQLKIALKGIDSAEKLMVAYEPVWSIGEGGTPATVDEVLYTVEQIHITLEELFGTETKIPVLYGGSVNMDNCAEYAQLSQLDGLFVGRAVRQIEGFETVLQKSLAARK